MPGYTPPPGQSSDSRAGSPARGSPAPQTGTTALRQSPGPVAPRTHALLHGSQEGIDPSGVSHSHHASGDTPARVLSTTNSRGGRTGAASMHARADRAASASSSSGHLTAMRETPSDSAVTVQSAPLGPPQSPRLRTIPGLLSGKQAPPHAPVPPSGPPPTGLPPRPLSAQPPTPLAAVNGGSVRGRSLSPMQDSPFVAAASDNDVSVRAGAASRPSPGPSAPKSGVSFAVVPPGPPTLAWRRESSSGLGPDKDKPQQQGRPSHTHSRVKGVSSRKLFPNADPRYDETLSPTAATLAAKYGGKWRRAVLGCEAAKQPRPHPLQLVTIRHVDGSVGIVHASHLKPLQAGVPVFTNGEATLTALHAQLPPGLHFLPGDLEDWGVSDTQYITCHFAAKGRLYVLLPEDTVEPAWLRSQFFKLREPLYGIQARLRMHWAATTVGDRLLSLVCPMRRATSQEEDLKVFKSKQVFLAGDQVALGGLPSAVLSDSQYIMAACCEGDEEDGAGVSAARRVGPTTFVSATDNFTDWGLWLARMVKAIKRNRIEDVRVLLKSDCWTQRPMRSGALSWLTPEEAGAADQGGSGGGAAGGSLLPGKLANSRGGPVLTTDLAIHTHSLEMLSLLLCECGCSLSLRGLRFLMYRWEDVPLRYGGAVAVLLGVVERSARPLSVVASVLATLREEISARESQRTRSSQELQHALRRFQLLQTALLEALSDVARTGGEGGMAHGLAWLRGVLDPPQDPRPVVVCDASPMRIAFEDRDFTFMATALMESYTKQLWNGMTLLALTVRDGTREFTLLDPTLMHTLMHKSGLCGKGMLSRALQMASHMWHKANVAPVAFFDSPRGRWMMRLMCNVAFIAVYTSLISDSNSKHPNMTRITSLCIVIDVFMLGSIVEAVELAGLRYKANISNYLSSNTQDVGFLLTEMLMFALVTTYLLASYGAIFIDEMTFLYIMFVWASLAIVVYLKFLTTLVPLFARLGPLLNTVYNMLSELQAFVLPFIVITCGFAAALYTVYSGWDVDEYRSFGQTLLTLFSAFLGNFDFSSFQQMPLRALEVYGIVILCCYLVLATILMANLLIAIISYKYRPDEVMAQSVFGLAEVVDKHQVQVDHHKLCSPFCMLQLVLALLPRGTRPAISHYALFNMGLTPIEGFQPALSERIAIPTGRDALPQLFFHLTLHPLLLAISNVAVYALAPFAITYYAFSGHKHSHHFGKGRSKGDTSSGRKSADSRGGSLSGAPSSGSMAGSLPSGSGASMRSPGRLASSFETVDSQHGDHQQGGDPFELALRHVTWQNLLYLPLELVKILLFAVVGAVLYLGVFSFVLNTLLGLYVWLACLVLTIYSIFHAPVAALMSACTPSAGRSAGAPDGGDGGPEDSVLKGVDSEQPNASGRASAAGSKGAESSAQRTYSAPKLTAGETVERWSAIARETAHRQAPRYLPRAQVLEAMHRVFGPHSTADMARQTSQAGTLLPRPSSTALDAAKDVYHIHAPFLNIRDLEGKTQQLVPARSVHHVPSGSGSAGALDAAPLHLAKVVSNGQLDVLGMPIAAPAAMPLAGHVGDAGAAGLMVQALMDTMGTLLLSQQQLQAEIQALRDELAVVRNGQQQVQDQDRQQQ